MVVFFTLQTAPASEQYSQRVAAEYSQRVAAEYSQLVAAEYSQRVSAYSVSIHMVGAYISEYQQGTTVLMMCWWRAVSCRWKERKKRKEKIFIQIK